MSEHSHELHILFDAPRAVIDPPRRPKIHAGTHSQGSFLEVLDDHERRIASVIGRFLDDPRDVEEAVQDTFVQAWRHRDDFRGDSAMFTWLYRIATNTALMRLRRRHVTSVSIDDVTGADIGRISDDPLDEHPERLATIQRVRSALAELPDHYRVVVILRDVEGLSNAETAETLGLPITTVKAHLHRGRVALRRVLHRRDDPADRECA